MKSASPIRRLQVYLLFLAFLLVLPARSQTRDHFFDKLLAEKMTADGAALDDWVLKGPTLSSLEDQARYRLGQALFFDPDLLRAPAREGGRASCAACHVPQHGFYSGVRVASGEGGIDGGAFRLPDPEYLLGEIDRQTTRTPTALNMFWKPGRNTLRRGDLGAGGLNAGLDFLPDGESPSKPPHWNDLVSEDGLVIQAWRGGEVVHRLRYDAEYLEEAYGELFLLAFPGVERGELFSGLYAAKAIAFYEMNLVADEAPLQLWLQHAMRGHWSRAAPLMTREQKLGGVVFFGEGRCTQCHGRDRRAGGEINPALMGAFAAIGTPGMYPEKDAEDKGRAQHTGASDDADCYMVPGLYNIGDDRFYFRGGTETDLEDVVRWHWEVGDRQAGEPGVVLDSRVLAIPELSPAKLEWLADFLENALRDSDLTRYAPEEGDAR